MLAVESHVVYFSSLSENRNTSFINKNSHLF